MNVDGDNGSLFGRQVIQNMTLQSTKHEIFHLSMEVINIGGSGNIPSKTPLADIAIMFGVVVMRANEV